MKWIKPNATYSSSTMVNVTVVRGGVRISFPKEDCNNITKSGKMVFGIEGDRLYFADDPHGYKMIERTYRKYIILWKNYEDLIPFAGKHPLFVDGMYYITTDNKE